MTCCIFDTLSVTESKSTSLESSKIWQRAAKKAKLKQHPYSYNGLLKSADLLHKWGFVDSQLLRTVMKKVFKQKIATFLKFLISSLFCLFSTVITSKTFKLLFVLFSTFNTFLHILTLYCTSCTFLYILPLFCNCFQFLYIK